ncbi:Tgt2/MlaC family protein [Solidesulfovibrio sp.]
MQRFAACLVLLLILMTANVSGAVAGPATDTLSRSVDRIIALLADPAYKDTGTRPGMRAKLIAAIAEIFDMKELSRRALGPEWNKFTPEQQERFVTAFGTLLENTYLDKIESYTDEKVQYLKEQDLGDGKAEVATTVVGNGKEIPIAYRLVDRSGWKVYDVIIEGVSLVQNYRSQFGQILMRESPEALIAKISAKRS